MFWNERAIPSQALLMANGQLGMETPDATGLNAGIYGDRATPNGNAWDNFNLAGKGDNNLQEGSINLASLSSTIFVMPPLVADDVDGIHNCDLYVGTDTDDSNAETAPTSGIHAPMPTPTTPTTTPTPTSATPDQRWPIRSTRKRTLLPRAPPFLSRPGRTRVIGRAGREHQGPCRTVSPGHAAPY